MIIYNTLTKKKEPFIPIKPPNVNIYVCGVTVYDHCHIGHARAYITFDTIRRFLEFKGYKVKFIQNFTDVDDKIINKAKANKASQDLHKACNEITKKYIKEYFKVMDKLNIKRADLYPLATEHITQIIEIIISLIENGHAYEKEGDVFFRVRKFSSYGKLSGRHLDDMQSGSRVDIDTKKEDPLDFALWKNSKPEEPFWESPWGKGRPGWHIECSAMSMQYLGETIDIHGGGKDLIFPHHENEIAQSESVTGKPFAKYWVHNGFLNIDKEKMSKSLGNFLTLKDVLAKYKPEALRLFFLQTHYRSPIDFSDKRLQESQKALEKFYNIFNYFDNSQFDISKIEGFKSADTEQAFYKELQLSKDQVALSFYEEFIQALADDFNTPKAMAVLFDLVKNINQIINKYQNISPGKAAECSTSYEKEQFSLSIYINLLKKLGNILGLFENIENNNQEEIPEEIQLLALEREKARSRKDWEKADQVRDLLSKKGFVVEDTANGMRLMRKELF